MINPLGLGPLTAKQADVLRRLTKDEAELTEAIPGGWWLGLDEIDGRICWNLLRRMALHQGYYTDGYNIYTINETGRELLAQFDKASAEAGGSHADENGDEPPARLP